MNAKPSQMNDDAPEHLTSVRFNSKVGLCMAFLVIFTSAVLVAGLNYPPKAAEMPLMVAGAGAVFSLLQLLIELYESRRPFEEKVSLARDLPIYAWVWTFVVGIALFGFLLAAPPMLFVYLRFRSRESWVMSLSLSAAVFALLYGLFDVVLSVSLWEGLVTPTIIDWLLPS